MIGKKKKKISIPFLIFGGIVFGYIGYLIGGAWKPGIQMMDYIAALKEELNHPFRDYYNQYTLWTVGGAIFLFALIMAIYYTSRGNYMPGKEFGTARFADAKEINKALKGDTPTGEKGEHRILSQHVRMNIDNRLTKYNNNILVIGGSGAKKTFGFVKPNIMQLNTSFIITDPKGEILRSEGEFLKAHGYNVRVLNLIDMDASFGYNPFEYIREPNDIPILIGNIIGNTTPKNASQSDPFWEKSEGMFLQSLFYYVWIEEPKKTRNLRSVMELLRQAEVTGNDEMSELDRKMSALATTSILGESHPAYVMYKKSMSGAADTVRSIIISANARLAKIESESVLRLFDHDEMGLEELGIGENGDEQTKTALFCLIPDSDKTYNFIVGMLYTQAFQRLYKIADEEYSGELPIHVSFMLDEFANVALPDDFCSLISTMRSRSISSIIIIQNLAQIKALFKDTWETITGNCDTLIYLGGNEQSTHEYISKLLGKGTIGKRSSGESRGRQGSSSRSYDVIGRELLTPDEVGRLDRNLCIVKVAGQFPIIDQKYDTPKHPRFMETADGNGLPYVSRKKESAFLGKPFEILGEKSLAFYEKKKDGNSPEVIYIDTLTYDEFMLLDELTMMDRFLDMEAQSEVAKVRESDGASLVYQPSSDNEDDGGNKRMGLIRSPKAGFSYDFEFRKDLDQSGDTVSGSGTLPGETIDQRLERFEFTIGQRSEIMKAIEAGVPESVVLSYAFPENNPIKLATYRNQYSTGQLKSA